MLILTTWVLEVWSRVTFDIFSESTTKSRECYDAIEHGQLFDVPFPKKPRIIRTKQGLYVPTETWDNVET